MLHRKANKVKTVSIRGMLSNHWQRVKIIYESGIPKGVATFKLYHPIGSNGIAVIYYLAGFSVIKNHE